MTKEEVYNDYVKSQEIVDDIKSKEDLKEELFLQWSELIESLE